MAMAMRYGSVFCVLLAFGATRALSQELRPVTIAAGTTSTVVKGVIKGRAEAGYAISLAQGQRLRLTLMATNRWCYMNVNEPGMSSVVHSGSKGGPEFSQNPTKPGIYKAKVFLTRSAARRKETCRYNLSVDVLGPSGN